jgi:predicted dithiol-disulfide oxidoreductase (DUF899 family)
MKSTPTTQPKIAAPEQWLVARRELLRQEKEFTKQRDQLSQQRRELPWVKIDKSYVFDSSKGPVTLADLFEGHSQLIVQHFMFGSSWEQGCKSCSYMMDHFNPAVPHLNARDVSFAAISRAPLAEILPFKARMGWAVNWVSAHGNDFNQDYHVSFTPEELARELVDYNYTQLQFPLEEAPGISVFARDAAGNVYHTYSTYGRGVEVVMGTYNLLDLVPKGRDEDPEATMSWVRYHDRYELATANA